MTSLSRSVVFLLELGTFTFTANVLLIYYKLMLRKRK